ncbi:hypothetical protein L1987_20206 [Smallanthus sonchifolius]|uniref:Uncharacterized protein n=1 Tax=Smallanthus sonchifolius TaxID=185202 RepID=A0ACB9IRE3_9ASTR|nr:hypothetical protein L1987_20206 [Smallanthus sonchifolius]
MFNSGIRAKGLESHEEWDSKSSRAEEDGVPAERRSRDDRLRVRPEGNMAGPSNLGLDSKIRSMRLCKSRLNKQDAAKRVVGEVEAFKGETGVRVNETETETEKCSFSNNKVRENAKRGSSVTEKSRRGWFGQTSEDGSMRDQRSVAQRRITIGLEKRCLDSDTCEKIMAKKSTNMKGFNCHSKALEIDFENLVKWFINKVLNIQSEKPFPSKKLSLPWELSENLKITYMSYLDLLEWYYIKTKKNKINIRESSSSGESKFKKRRVSMVNKQEKDEMNDEESKGNKEESENEDVVVEDSK